MSDGEPQATAANLLREERLQRNLKIVVGGLAVLILVGLGAVVAKVVGVASGSLEGGLGIKRVVTSPVASLALEIPKGARIVSVSLSGNRLAVQHEGPDGTGITILDIETGKSVAEIRPIEALPRN
jgi:hypothetical protein